METITVQKEENRRNKSLDAFGKWRGNSRHNGINGRSGKVLRREAAFKREGFSSKLSIKEKLDRIDKQLRSAGYQVTGAQRQRARYITALDKQKDQDGKAALGRTSLSPPPKPRNIKQDLGRSRGQK